MFSIETEFNNYAEYCVDGELQRINRSKSSDEKFIKIKIELEKYFSIGFIREFIKIIADPDNGWRKIPDGFEYSISKSLILFSQNNIIELIFPYEVVLDEKILKRDRRKSKVIFLSATDVGQVFYQTIGNTFISTFQRVFQELGWMYEQIEIVHEVKSIQISLSLFYPNINVLLKFNFNLLAGKVELFDLYFNGDLKGIRDMEYYADEIGMAIFSKNYIVVNEIDCLPTLEPPAEMAPRDIDQRNK